MLRSPDEGLVFIISLFSSQGELNRGAKSGPTFLEQILPITNVTERVFVKFALQRIFVCFKVVPD